MIKRAQSSNISKNESRENAERALRHQLEEYAKEQQDANSILNDMRAGDLENMIKEAMRADGSVLNQEQFKSTSNENINKPEENHDNQNANKNRRSKKNFFYGC